MTTVIKHATLTNAAADPTALVDGVKWDETHTITGLDIGTDVQAHDTTLDALAALDGTAGLLTQTGADTFVRRTLTGTANEVTVTNGAGTSSNPTISLPDALTFTPKTVTGGIYTSASSMAIGAATNAAVSKLYVTDLAVPAGYMTFEGGQSSASTIAHGITHTMAGVNSPGADSSGITSVIRHFAAANGYATSSNGANIRAGEFQALRATGTLQANTWGLEIGVHSQVAGDGINYNVGAYILSSHTGWLSSGVRNDTGVLVVGEDGWTHSFLHYDTNGTTVLTDLDQNGVVYGRGGLATNSTSATNRMIIKNTETLSADRTLNINVANGNKTLTMTGDFTMSGAFNATLTLTGTTNVTFPTTGTLATLSGVETLDGKTLTNVVSETIVGGTLANGVQALNIAVTNAPTPVATTQGILFNITGNGSASQTHRGMVVNLLAGYTGSSATHGLAMSNASAGTGTTVIPAAGTNTGTANFGFQGACTGTTSGANIGSLGEGRNGNINVGALGLSQFPKNSATNIGVAGSAINSGTSPVVVGGWFSLNQTTIPTVSAALIADNASQALPVALFQVAGATKSSINANGHYQSVAVAVASLPAAGNKGARAFVTDATVTTFASTVAGGGANNVPVFDDGTNWKIG